MDHDTLTIGSRLAPRRTRLRRRYLGAPIQLDRERRLWLFTLAVLAVIYSTLGLARELAVALRDANLLFFTFFSTAR